MADLITNLVSWWALDEESGDRADEHGSNTLTDNNTVTFRTGVASNGADFDDANTEYLETESALVANVPFSVAGWVITDDLTAQQTIFFLGDKDSSDKYFRVCVRGDVANDVLSAEVNNGTFDDGARTSTGMSAATWAHFVAVYAAANDRKIYINGGSVGSDTTSIDVVTVMDRTGLGRCGDTTPTLYLDGGLDEVALFDKALSANEVTWLYNGGTARTYADMDNDITPAATTAGCATVNPTVEYRANHYSAATSCGTETANPVVQLASVLLHARKVDNYLIARSDTL